MRIYKYNFIFSHSHEYLFQSFESNLNFESLEFFKSSKLSKVTVLIYT